ncbi:pyridoxamine 5'-phosphate oxidase family protein [Streptomyces sp. G-G2]|uniref:pyridoxamine 5'-phosphate oxidase family protein n=1 Tax=Streptomyces sp. G-G2 TaxID=3046201 RepID=UPI0024B90617|nr:pyridoxamine 5'-phosphate oxidase family protein [Streptomyces sp. G-G2]MDJ0380454.1 pyridoxamine 5'-phosphate oxidase family protein [Streptomyces sp. G-G2]
MSTSEETGHRRAAPDRTARPGSAGEHLLQQRTGTAERADTFYAEQVLDRLNTRMRDFVARQEMFFLATADGHGECDNTFRAGPPGFLHVLDDRTLAYPEYRGNGVQASLGNIEENPHVGILMVDFLRDRIGLHVNGRARIVGDDEMRRAHSWLAVDPVPGRRARVWVEVAVEEAYIHCAKHIPPLQKVPPQGPDRAWGTDDVKRKGGDFFGAAAEAHERGRFEPPPRADTPAWRAEAERVLERAERRRTEQPGGRAFSGWFRTPDRRAASWGLRNQLPDAST